MTRVSLYVVVVTVVALCLSLPALAGPTALQRTRTIVIDPGHGGEDPGAPGPGGVFEKDIVLDMALRIERALRGRTDAEIYLTRRDDRYVGLRERTRFANQVGADVFLSIHCNADPAGRGHGVETFFLSTESSDEETARLVAFENERLAHEEAPAADPGDRELAGMLKDLTVRGAHQDAESLAGFVLDRLVSRTRGRSRGVKQAPFAVLKEAEMPAVVVEVGFLSHADEGGQLLEESRQEAIAVAIAEAVIAFDRAALYR